MFLQVFYKDTTHVGPVVDEISKLCTVVVNTMKPPVREEDYWYFSVDVEMTCQQLKDALFNNDMHLDVIGINNENGAFLVMDKKYGRIQQFTSMISFRDDKMKVTVGRSMVWSTE